MPAIARTGTGVVEYQRHPGSVWIEGHRDALPDQCWVAANADGLVAQDPTIDGLMGQLRSRDIDQDDVAIAFITSDSA